METRVSAVLEHKGSEVVTVTPDQSIASFAYLLYSHRIGAAPVVANDGAVVGMISERDIVRGIVQHGGSVVTLPVKSLMTTLVSHCSPDDTIVAVMEMITRQRRRHIPVCQNGRLQGMISIGDVVKQRLDEAQYEVDSLRHYITSP